MAKLISKIYGEALFLAAVEKNSLDEYFKAGQTVTEILEFYPSLADLMAHPDILKEDKKKMVEELFAGKIPEEMVGLMILMIAKGRIGKIKETFDYFLDLVKEEKRIGKAEVTTVFALSERQKKRIEKKLIETTHYQSFEMRYLVDESLIGGMIIRIGDRVVDSSIQTKLDHLSRQLRKVQI